MHQQLYSNNLTFYQNVPKQTMAGKDMKKWWTVVCGYEKLLTQLLNELFQSAIFSYEPKRKG